MSRPRNSTKSSFDDRAANIERMMSMLPTPQPGVRRPRGGTAGPDMSEHCFDDGGGGHHFYFPGEGTSDVYQELSTNSNPFDHTAFPQPEASRPGPATGIDQNSNPLIDTRYTGQSPSFYPPLSTYRSLGNSDDVYEQYLDPLLMDSASDNHVPTANNSDGFSGVYSNTEFDYDLPYYDPHITQSLGVQDNNTVMYQEQSQNDGLYTMGSLTPGPEPSQPVVWYGDMSDPAASYQSPAGLASNRAHQSHPQVTAPLNTFSLYPGDHNAATNRYQPSSDHAICPQSDMNAALVPTRADNRRQVSIGPTDPDREAGPLWTTSQSGSEKIGSYIGSQRDKNTNAPILYYAPTGASAMTVGYRVETTLDRGNFIDNVFIIPTCLHESQHKTTQQWARFNFAVPSHPSQREDPYERKRCTDAESKAEGIFPSPAELDEKLSMFWQIAESERIAGKTEKGLPPLRKGYTVEDVPRRFSQLLEATVRWNIEHPQTEEGEQVEVDRSRVTQELRHAKDSISLSELDPSKLHPVSSLFETRSQLSH